MSTLTRVSRPTLPPHPLAAAETLLSLCLALVYAALALLIALQWAGATAAFNAVDSADLGEGSPVR